MSQHVVYKCNHCHREIGAKAHITLMMSRGTGTGIAIPPGTMKEYMGWHTFSIPENFLHFHDGKCIGAFFDGLIKSATTSKK